MGHSSNNESAGESEDGDDVELARDHYWWLNPALRGQQALGSNTGDSLPWRWLSFATRDEAQVAALDTNGPYGDFAKLLYKLNGYRPGPVRGWFVIVQPTPEQFAVGQLWVDPNIPVVLFDDLLFENEEAARAKAEQLREREPGLTHRS